MLFLYDGRLLQHCVKGMESCAEPPVLGEFYWPRPAP
jgi:hypothetical protein